MELVLDLHLHSRFSRAVSPRMNLVNMYIWGRKKGINVLSITDFTHPVWFKEAKSQLVEKNPGIYTLKSEAEIEKTTKLPAREGSPGMHYIWSTEVAAIYTENGKSHRIHNLIFSPNMETCEKINQVLSNRGINLTADGRPILGISTKQLCELLFEIDPKITVIPCHVWTPWFSLYGSRSGYDTIVDCFGKYAPRIFAIETGISSDPSMNWRIPELSTRSIVSFSDAHSLEKMGREATVLQPINGGVIRSKDITYDNILNGLVRGRERVFKMAYTIEFYPEEGKYHYTGHRNCKVSYTPTDDKTRGTVCPVCKRELTVGVMHRVEDLAKTSSDNFTYEKDKHGVTWVIDSKSSRPKSVSLVPLLEILAEVYKTAPNSQKVLTVYDSLVNQFGSEHEILLRADVNVIRKQAGDDIAEGILKVRSRDIAIIPGFDGEYGKVSIWSENKKPSENEAQAESQMGLI